MATENIRAVEEEPGARTGRTSFEDVGPALRRLDTLLERALERRAERNLLERIRLADRTLVYGKPIARTTE